MKVMKPDGSGFGKLELTNDKPAHNTKELMASLNMMLAHSAGLDKTPKSQMMMIREAMKRNKVTCEEAVDAFWAAYKDPYVSQGRIEFRHMWKHIDKMRTGEDGKTYTYNQMLGKMDRENIPMDCFEMIDEKDSQGWNKWVIK